MYLKRLKVRNFKSFAGATEVPFSPGFTGVAGPNGMGKSNISDAILFVLGPPSSKALRADRLTHLFFNGGASKKPATECEVSLIFDNKDRALAVEADEVEFTRYVKLAPSDPDGYYSYFYVNKRRSTQTEIETLLSHARLSGDGYNLVQQGDINRIVAMSPLERRTLVERLAGIAQYDEDLEKAEVKKGDLDANLTQIHTLLGEVTRRMGELDGQRTLALRYKTLADEKKGCEARLARATLARSQQEVKSCEKRLAELSTTLDGLKSKLGKLAAERTRLNGEIDQVQTEIARRGGEEARKLKLEVDARTLELGRLQMNVENAEGELEKLSAQKADLEKEVASRRKEIAAQEKSVETQQAELDGIEAEVQAHAKEVQAAQSSTDLTHGKAVEVRKQTLVNDKRQAEKQAAWQEVIQRLETARASVTTAEHDRAVAEDAVRSSEMEVNDLEFRAKETRSSKKGGERSSQELTTELHQLRAKEKTLTARSQDLTAELLELNRAFASLDARLKERAGGGSGGPGLAADYLLSQKALGRLPGVRGKVEDLIRFDEQYSTALATAAGNRFQALIVETDEVAQQCIDLLLKEKKGRCTLLPLNKMTSGRPHGKSLIVQRAPGSRGFALDLVKCDAEIAPALWYVFGETLIMETLAQARAQMGGVRLATLRGELIEATGAMTGGSLGERKGNDNAVQLKRLAADLESRTTESTAVQAELKTVSEKVRALSEELARRSAETTAHGSNLEQIDKELAHAREALEQARARGKEAVARHREAEKACEVADAESHALQQEIDRLKEEHEALQKEYLNYLPANVSSRLKKLQETGSALAERRIKVHGELEALKSSLSAARETLKVKESELKQLGEDLTARTKALKTLRSDLAEIREKVEALKAVETTQSKASTTLLAKKDALTQELMKVSADESGANSTFTSQSAIHQDASVRLETARAQLAVAEEAAKSLAEEDGKAPVPTLSLEELRKKIQEIENEIGLLGPVNAQALEQYDQEKARLDDFQGEVDRLGQERDGLNKLVTDIEEKKRTRLTEVIKGVDEGYRTIYAELSGGGEGELVLENPEDPLKGGLLIKAKPLGKKVARLEQLSGGEKSLASLAFIFSLQKFDPSPLYVLDEVDMSLDGVNAENIGRLLRRNSTHAQFIVISLRKVTLKWAEHLFGVTMHGDGVSRVIGIRLDDIIDVDEKELQSTATPPSAAARIGGEA